MQAVLNVTEKEINSELIALIKLLFDKNISEVVIKNSELKFEEFDSSVSPDEIVGQMSSYGYSDMFLSEVKAGLENSSVYKK